MSDNNKSFIERYEDSDYSKKIKTEMTPKAVEVVMKNWGYFFESTTNYVPSRYVRYFIDTQGAAQFLECRLTKYLYLPNCLVEDTEGNTFSIEGIVEVNNADIEKMEGADARHNTVKSCKLCEETTLLGSCAKNTNKLGKVILCLPIKTSELRSPIQPDTPTYLEPEVTLFKHSDIEGVAQEFGLIIRPYEEAKFKLFSTLVWRIANNIDLNYKAAEKTDLFFESLVTRASLEVKYRIQNLERALLSAEIAPPDFKESYTHSSELLQIQEKLIWQFWERHDPKSPPTNAEMGQYLLENWPAQFSENGKDEVNSLGKYIIRITRPDAYKRPK